MDVWSAGVIFFVMLAQTSPWKVAEEFSDLRYKNYIDNLDKPSSRPASPSGSTTSVIGGIVPGNGGGKYPSFEKFSSPVKSLLYGMLKPDPNSRFNITQIMADPWFVSISCCDLTNGFFVDHKHENFHIKQKHH